MGYPISNDMWKSGHYLGLSIMICPAMTGKILTENGQVLHRSMYRPFTPDDSLNKDGSDAREQLVGVPSQLENT